MRKSVAILALLFLAACSNANNAKDQQIGTALAGGLVGGLMMYKSGQLVLTALAASLGARIGWEIGKQELLPSDISRFKTSAKLALEDPRDGQLYNWANPSTGVAGTIKPTRTYYAGDNIYCRDFEVKIAVDEDIKDASTRACRLAGGPWYLDPNA